MKKLFFLLFCFISVCSIGQQSITDKLVASVKNGGIGVAYFNMNYVIGNYKTQETDVITINVTDTNNITYSIHFGIQDSSKSILDSTFILSSIQVGLLNSFYQSASNGNNPDPAISSNKTGASGKLTVSLCCGDAIDMIYSTPIHISLGRYLLSYWTNWN